MFKKLVLLSLIPVMVFAVPVQIKVDTLTAKVERNGGLAVNIQDQTSDINQIFFIKTVDVPTGLLFSTEIDSYYVVVDSVELFDSLTDIYIADANNSFLAMVLDTSGDTVYLDGIVPKIFNPDSAIVLPITKNMNVDGSVTRVEYFASLPTNANVQIDITGIRIHIIDGSAMDDGLFGSLPALERGCTLHKKNASGESFFYNNFKTNGDIIASWDNNEYNEKARSGEFGFTSTWEIAGQENMGVTIRLSPGDKLIFTIQDDLSDLTELRLYLYGHYVTD